MALYLPPSLPTAAILSAEGLPIIDGSPSARAVRVGVLNLMPTKERTELDLGRVLAWSDIDVQLTLLKIPGQTYRHTPQAHMDAYYVDAVPEHMQALDGLIVTGAPVEHLPFSEVRYWPQLCELMDWAHANVRSTLYVCWGAQAALSHFFGVPKHPLPQKRFGVFAQHVLCPSHPLLQGLPEGFPMPHSRHTETRASELATHPELSLIAAGDESGVGIVTTPATREICITGHLEYAPDTLHTEYMRDVNQGLPIQAPAHYYYNDEPATGVNYSWRNAARQFYRSWLSVASSPNSAGE